MPSLNDRLLRRWYREFNQRWFAETLPPDVDVLYAPIEGCSGDVIDDPAHGFVIRIDPMFALCQRMVKLTLLHEMVHVELWPYRTHGPRFQRRMEELAAAGALRGLW